MSFFKKVFSKVGIGAAKVDTILDRDLYRVGEPIDAIVKIKGGSVEQQIDALYFSMHCNYIGERENSEGEEVDVTRTATIDQFKLGESMLIQPGEEIELAVDMEVPLDAPLTFGRTKVWLKTGLDIKAAVDPGDRDYFQIQPDHMQANVFQALEDLGFQMHEAECEEASRWNSRLPFLQEFEFKPISGPYYRRLDEIEIVFNHGGDHLEVLMEIDRRARGFSGFLAEAMNRDETKTRFTISDEHPGEVLEIIQHIIDDNI
ncbi:sporulation protein [Acanthopleuribacter pedis]|uniref:Sporulation protein n=1 Tax=Acanthopleuribacter pedis TaxID=442870 RepID=A0A8J7QMQ3_9BACT|nr:sporulation protein [Acanthopleuribacter pedis]MBO1320830.1 sporulation protein [Acanthopleuribacter pedis]